MRPVAAALMKYRKVAARPRAGVVLTEAAFVRLWGLLRCAAATSGLPLDAVQPGPGLIRTKPQRPVTLAAADFDRLIGTLVVAVERSGYGRLLEIPDPPKPRPSVFVTDANARAAEAAATLWGHYVAGSERGPPRKPH